MVSTVRTLSGLGAHPIARAPMAAGVSGPPLAAAVCEAGGLGFLTGGYERPEATREEIREPRRLIHRPFGVNLSCRSRRPRLPRGRRCRSAGRRPAEDVAVGGHGRPAGSDPAVKELLDALVTEARDGDGDG